MSGGFGIIVGYIFAFLVLISVFTAALNTYNTQISEQQRILQATEKNAQINLNYGYDFLNPYSSSGRISFLLENGQDKLLYKLEDRSFCFNFFLNGVYFSSSNDLFINLVDKMINVDYRFIPQNSQGIITLKNNIDTNLVYTLKTISCDGIEKLYVINSSTIDWWDSSFDKRKRIIASNVASESIVDYQMPVILNSSNFDFSIGKQNELRFALPIKENYVLDLPFDDNLQTQNEYSKYSNVAYLGSGAGVEGSDPTFDSLGVVFGGLSFDGVNDLIQINPSSSLMLDKSLTYSAWIKWNMTGNNFQNIFTNGYVANSLVIINDGGANDNKLRFQLNISGTLRTLISSNTLDNNWHFVSGTYDGYNMNLYVDGNLVASGNYLGEVSSISLNNYVGSSGSGNFFNGLIDEVKVINFALNQDEIDDAYHNNLKFKELDFYVSNWNPSLDIAKIYVKVPFVKSNSNVSFDMYYFSKVSVVDKSSIEAAFSYDAPRTVGIVVSGRAQATGLTISSLYDNNIVYVDNGAYSLDHSQSAGVGAGSIFGNTTIKMKYLAQVEGQGQGGDIIVPISWAGTEFVTTGMPNNPDRLCFIAPFGNAVISIYTNNVFTTNLNVNSGTNGVCDSRNFATTANIRIVSTMPVLVFTSGPATFTNDARPIMPASSDDWYGVGSAAMYVNAFSGSTTNWYSSNGLSGTYTLTTANTGSRTAQGNNGAAPAFKLVSNNKIAAIQYRDVDGNEQSSFGTLNEMGKIFGSGIAMDYVAAASPYSDANCSIYNSADNLVLNIATGTGANGVYYYGLGTGNNVQLAAANWYLHCDKPVWPYFESTIDNERNLFGHLQMRQYIYPEPIVEVK